MPAFISSSIPAPAQCVEHAGHQGAALEIDPLRFAESAQNAAGEYALESLTRLHDLLLSRSGALRWSIEGGRMDGRPVLHVRVDGELTLICQRCLGPYVWSVQVRSTLPVARDEAQLRQWECDDPLLDALVAEPRLSVHELIEDEVLLSLPPVVRHPHGTCMLCGVPS
ncbi:MAG: YceD family protein [Thiobacillaceae bacterium]|nr:YceD family protein [Thiobacillaceae bacterium]MCX7674071.1 YceD family protein [Thiobacillaceae bacterium]MDW8324236.1 YceD family protein [Burkholderiales bacterium]